MPLPHYDEAWQAPCGDRCKRNTAGASLKSVGLAVIIGVRLAREASSRPPMGESRNPYILTANSPVWIAAVPVLLKQRAVFLDQLEEESRSNSVDVTTRSNSGLRGNHRARIKG